MTVSSVGWNNAWSYVKRAAKVYPDLVLGTGGEVVSSTLKDSFYGLKGVDGKRVGGKHFTGFWAQLKGAFKSGEVHNDALVKKHGGFWKAQWEAIKTTPKTISDCFKDGGKTAELAGKSKIWGHTKGVFKGLGKRLPIIGSAIMVLTELPNIFKATKNEGIVSGAAEVAKAGARLGGGMLLGTIGAALGGPIGALVGFAVGDWLTSKIVGKSYSEKKVIQDEEMKKIANSQTNTNNIASYPPSTDTSTASKTTSPFMSGMQPTMSPQELMQLQQALASGYGIRGSGFDTYA